MHVDVLRSYSLITSIQENYTLKFREPSNTMHSCPATILAYTQYIIIITPSPIELFHMEIVRSGTVKILGYLIPPTKVVQIKWYLTIGEDGQGVLDREPAFRPEDFISVKLIYTHD